MQKKKKNGSDKKRNEYKIIFMINCYMKVV